MDPHQTLADIRDSISAMRRAHSESAAGVLADEAITSFEALDEWLSRGGHLPDAWAVRRPAVEWSSDQKRIGQDPFVGLKGNHPMADPR